MAEFNHWPSGARDTTEFPEIGIQISSEFRDHLSSFCKMDGIGWNEYDAQGKAGELECSDSRLRTFRKLYERQGLLYKEDDKIRLSRLGKQLVNLENELTFSKDALLNEIRKTAIDILSRYQLKNPIDGPDLPESCDILPSICIWKAMRQLDNRLHYEELNRIILRVLEMSDLDAAIGKIQTARNNLPNYPNCSNEELTQALGDPVFTDQASARIAPWYSFVGWGGLIIDRNIDHLGFRNLNEESIPLIDQVLANPPSYFATNDRDEWSHYYIGAAAENSSESNQNANIIVKTDDTTDKVLSIQELGAILKEMYDNAGAGSKVCSIHVCGIKYGDVILDNDYKPSDIIKAAGLNDSYYTELNKGVNIYKALKNGTYGITFAETSDHSDDYDSIDRITGGENILLYGVPGSGKSHYIEENYTADPDCIERVVFHPDYTYSDFIGQILPRVENNQLKYIFTPGPFTKILYNAKHYPGKKFYLIIEEINRGNAPAIFGEVFQLLDRNEDGAGKYSITNYDIATIVYGDATKKVSIPSNLWILATMNTSDQNVFTLDTAFQRRWVMKLIENDIQKAVHARIKIEGSEIDWGTFATNVNEDIISANKDLLTSEDKRLGAYFVSPRELQRDRFPEKVLKFLWDDAYRMDKAIFSEDLESFDKVVAMYNGPQENDPLRRVLRTDLYNKMLTEMHKQSSDKVLDSEDNAVAEEKN